MRFQKKEKRQMRTMAASTAEGMGRKVCAMGRRLAARQAPMMPTARAIWRRSLEVPGMRE
jgi:hypothetical protein